MIDVSIQQTVNSERIKMALKLPTTQAELTAMLKKARNEGFNSGTVAALAVVTGHDQAVIWREIVRAAGVYELLRWAKKDQGSWSWGGFKKYARKEFGSESVKAAIESKPKTLVKTK